MTHLDDMPPSPIQVVQAECGADVVEALMLRVGAFYLDLEVSYDWLFDQAPPAGVPVTWHVHAHARKGGHEVHKEVFTAKHGSAILYLLIALLDEAGAVTRFVDPATGEDYDPVEHLR